MHQNEAFLKNTAAQQEVLRQAETMGQKYVEAVTEQIQRLNGE